MPTADQLQWSKEQQQQTTITTNLMALQGQPVPEYTLIHSLHEFVVMQYFKLTFTVHSFFLAQLLDLTIFFYKHTPTLLGFTLPFYNPCILHPIIFVLY